MTIIATLIVLGVLIFVHELGHFAAAKAVGVEVQRFSIGLGPKLFGFQWGETEYVISWIPLGGYVKMGGMEDEVMERLEGGEEVHRTPPERAFDHKPIWARTLVISAGVIMNMLFAFAVYTFVVAKWGVAEIGTTRVGMVMVETLPDGAEALARVEPGSRVVRVGERVVEDWGDVQRALLEAPPGPLVIELDDPPQRVEITLPPEETARRALVGSIAHWADAAVGQVNPGSPADRAGLQEGDQIVAVDGVPVSNWYEFVRQIEARPGQRVALTIVRDGRELVRTVTLDADEVEGPDGTRRVVGRIGIFQPLQVTYEPVGLAEAVRYGFRETVAVTGLILDFLKDLITREVSPRSVGSIVTIGAASGQAAEAGADAFLRFMALFSINLAVLNLLPIPVLDGGHLLFIAIEALRGGRGLTLEQKMRWSNVGFIIVMALMLWALSNDVLRLLGL